MKTVLQVLAGLALCAVMAYVLTYHTNLTFWEPESLSGPGVTDITWRSYTALVALLALTLGISFAVFQFFSRRQTSPSTN